MTVKSLRKQLAAAIAMTLVATVALGSSTYAWFAMNTTVKATAMQVKATAEVGLLINEVATAADTNWDDVATANQPTGAAAIQLYPTSTANGTAWVHANSLKSGSHAGATGTAAGDKSADLTTAGYTTLTLANNSVIAATAGSQAAINTAYVDGDTDGSFDAEEHQYYAKYTYYLKSSSDDTLTLGTDAGDQNVSILATATGTSGSADLDSALRVGVAVDGKFYIFAPITGATTTYYYNAGGTGAAEVTAYTTQQATCITSLPNTSTNGKQVDIYIWFEGEDAGCKTDNITASLDTLSVEVNFELVSLAADATDNGVSMN